VEALEAELLSARKLGTGAQVFGRVLRRSLEAVGQLWHSGEISIGHEHVASETINATARELLRLAQPSDTNRVALLASFADELHYGSLYGVGLVLAEAGCRVAMLGALTPPAALGPAVRKLTPEIVGLSVTIAPSGARARELVEGYAIACGNVPWVVGGRGVGPIARLVTEFGGIVAQGSEDDTRRLFQSVLSERRHSS
jgi:MerR family transcriptional regulator, light-induced transcriptional regulator